MGMPDYKRPFHSDDFRGYFTWTEELTNRFAGSYFYHACHQDELEDILVNRKLILRSEWSLEHPMFGQWTSKGVWVGLNAFHNGNYYGPFVLKFPIRLLNGKRFMAFRRKGDRDRYFFVQYETDIPLFDKNGNAWRRIKPSVYFNDNDGELSRKEKAIYDFILTSEIFIGDAEIDVENHPKCISQKCNGARKSESRKLLKQIAQEEFEKRFIESPRMRKFLRQFPIMEGRDVTLPEGE
ncbi:hypothetical protein [Bacillus sp. AFS040349]|uniref:hypothetical protein n=1 Tax=Bacillus sp. AFS040349 TaxID=2033502 RepID=UPI000BFBF523|nr:hypothetical protein [Bacillus sp. AFS040349]PGT81541.1 hypothetical protein COD11_17060 [Bacillus sp. AFS040349]